MKATLTTHDLDGLAHAIDRQGIDFVPAELIQTLADQASEVGASSTLTTLIVDHREPRVARERAFVKLGTRLLSPHRPRRLGPQLAA
jgi:hypothetical protein